VRSGGIGLWVQGWWLWVEIRVEQEPPQGVLVCEHAGRVINQLSHHGVEDGVEVVVRVLQGDRKLVTQHTFELLPRDLVVVVAVGRLKRRCEVVPAELRRLVVPVRVY